MVDKRDENAQENSKSEIKPHFLKELSIKLTQNTRIRIITLFIIVTTSVTITWTIAEKYQVHTKLELENTSEELIDLQADMEKLRSEHNKLRSDYKELQKSGQVPILTFPVNKQSIIGRYITFRWEYDSISAYQNLVLELVRYSDGKLEDERRYQIPEADREQMYFEFPRGKDGTGVYFWRVGTGELLQTKDETRLWSRYGRFSVYASVVDRIKEKKEFIVGTSATFLSYDHQIDEDGRPQTFDMDFIDWIVKRLESKLQLPKESLVIKRKPIKWGPDLFNSVVNGEVDVAIANITKSVEREKKYPGLKFTTGYLDSRQVFVYSKASVTIRNRPIDNLKKLEEALQNEMVGLQRDSINYEVGICLQKRFKYAVDAKYNSYVDVIEAVIKQKVTFGLLDSVRLDTCGYPELERVQVNLTPLLSKYYKDKLGDATGEKYAIAVAGNEGEKGLLAILNEIIDKESETVINKLKEKHFKGRKLGKANY